MKRIFLDIETSPLLVCSWGVGRKINISYDNVVKERSIICICWKVEGSSKVNALQWSATQNDKAMLLEFERIIRDADELVGHNLKSFDLPWIRARCMFHQIPTLPDYKIADTLTMARSRFRFVSNRLDYLGNFLGYGGKEDTGGFGLWKSVVLENSLSSLAKMIKYCKKDVLLVEKVYNRLSPEVPATIHAGVLSGHEKWSCPRCESENVKTSKTKITAKGSKSYQMQCINCGGYYTISERVHKGYTER